jgi:hypothetical protein
LKEDEDAVRPAGSLNVADTLPERQQPEMAAHREDPWMGKGHQSDEPNRRQEPEQDDLTQTTSTPALRSCIHLISHLRTTVWRGA